MLDAIMKFVRSVARSTVAPRNIMNTIYMNVDVESAARVPLGISIEKNV